MIPFFLRWRFVPWIRWTFYTNISLTIKDLREIRRKTRTLRSSSRWPRSRCWDRGYRRCWPRPSAGWWMEKTRDGRVKSYWNRLQVAIGNMFFFWIKSEIKYRWGWRWMRMKIRKLRWLILGCWNSESDVFFIWRGRFNHCIIHFADTPVSVRWHFLFLKTAFKVG